MDDVAQPLVAKARDIIPLVQSVIAIYHETFAKFMLTINYSPGKTEVAFSFFGEGARMSKQCLQDQYAGGIPFITSRQSLLLQVPRTYKHLGTVASADMSMQPEITSKMTAMKNSVKAVKGDFLARPNIPLEPRLLVLKTLVFRKDYFRQGLGHCYMLASCLGCISK